MAVTKTSASDLPKVEARFKRAGSLNQNECFREAYRRLGLKATNSQVRAWLAENFPGFKFNLNGLAQIRRDLLNQGKTSAASPSAGPDRQSETPPPSADRAANPPVAEAPPSPNGAAAPPSPPTVINGEGHEFRVGDRVEVHNADEDINWAGKIEEFRVGGWVKVSGIEEPVDVDDLFPAPKEAGRPPRAVPSPTSAAPSPASAPPTTDGERVLAAIGLGRSLVAMMGGKGAAKSLIDLV